MPTMPEYSGLPDGSLMVLFYKSHDEGGCQLANCVVHPTTTPCASQRDALHGCMEVIATLVFHRNKGWLRGYLSRFRIYLDDDPNALASEVIYRALDTAHRTTARYDGKRPFRPWLRRIAQRVRLNHTQWHEPSDAELIREFRDSKNDRTRNRCREDFDDRYRPDLTDWFRKGCKRCGLSTRPEHLKRLVDETLEQLFARANEFDPEETAFIVWLSRLAKAVLAKEVLAAHAKGPISAMQDVTEYVPPQFEFIDDRDEEDAENGLAAPRNPDYSAWFEGFKDQVLRRAWQRLGPRERNVLEELAKGRITADVAADLGKAEGTINNDLANGRRKLKEYLEAWKSLTPLEQEALWAVDVDACSLVDVVARLRIDPSTVNDTLTSGREKLRMYPWMGGRL